MTTKCKFCSSGASPLLRAVQANFIRKLVIVSVVDSFVFVGGHGASVHRNDRAFLPFSNDRARANGRLIQFAKRTPRRLCNVLPSGEFTRHFTFVPSGNVNYSRGLFQSSRQLVNNYLLANCRGEGLFALRHVKVEFIRVQRDFCCVVSARTHRRFFPAQEVENRCSFVAVWIDGRASGWVECVLRVAVQGRRQAAVNLILWTPTPPRHIRDHVLRQRAGYGKRSLSPQRPRL